MTGAAPKQSYVTAPPKTNLYINFFDKPGAGAVMMQSQILFRYLLSGQVLWIAQLSSSRARAQAQLERKHASANSAGGEEAFQQKLSDRTSRQTLVDF